ncbi:SWIM zinc finger family protein [Allostreptomyces psammosilenae]|uniref:SWIM-type domain-containing protein n=1 Tax=Allostreptomyces psammosilenae TaxID=1892865 RepID=A0A853AC02_9ACTN|nr:SWIM zinc finger family protein [Allostreptomyces psammosilenae]NYI07902.1 hypothetical protein [Allostreptomyces psammosilenae]
MEDRWNAEQVLALAPDAASRKAGSKLSAPGPWSGTGTDGTFVWGECKGSGKVPYRTVADLPGTAFTCTCPSRKFPCKHSLALLLRWAEGAAAVPVAGEADRPQWVAEWAEKRRAARERSEQRKERAEAGPADPAAARRRAQQRERRIDAGVAELRQRVGDRIRAGLAPLESNRHGLAEWHEVAARMVDAQAPGLAARARELAALPVGSAVRGTAGAGWAGPVLEELALLHLLTGAWERRESLPEPLRATVRGRVGARPDGPGGTGADAAPATGSGDATSTAAESGTAAATEERIHDDWLVLGHRDAEASTLRSRRAWLRGAATGRTAMLLSYAGPGRALDPVPPTGTSVAATAVFPQAAAALRATLGPDQATARPAGPPPGGDCREAHAAYVAALAADPWTDAWPVVLAAVTPVWSGTGWYLADQAGQALRVDVAEAPEGAMWRLTATSAGRPATVFGEYRPSGFVPVTVWAPHDGRAVLL